MNIRAGSSASRAARMSTAAASAAAVSVAAIVGAAPAIAQEGSDKDPSIVAPPAELASDVGAKEVARVVSVREVNGQPVFEVFPVKGKQQAEAVVDREQQQDETVLVDVEKRQQFTAAVSDPLRTKQWGMTAVSVESAWRYSRGAGQKVAVIDTGVDASSPDLTGQVLAGADFVNLNCEYQQGTQGCDGRVDPNGHGSHVAGIIAAKQGNGIGVTGLAPDARVLPVRALDGNGSGYSSDVARAITWATNNGAGVLNLSLGGTFDPSIKQAVDYARSNGRVVVAASGNEGSSALSYPAALPNVIAVSATTSSNTVAGFSNYGSHLDLAAPGSSILSTYQGGYANASGTSMAAPHVSALAALLRSAAVAKGLGAVNVQKAMESSAIDIGARGRDARAGAGRIDAYRALCWIGACAPKVKVTASIGRSRNQFIVTSRPAGTRSVQLQQLVRGKWRTVVARKTNARGVIRLSVKPNASYRVEIPVTLRTTPWSSGVIRLR